MTIARRSTTDIDRPKRLGESGPRRKWTEAEIEAMAIEDDSLIPDEDLGEAVLVYPSTAGEVRGLRAKLGLSQAQFAQQFGFTVDTIQQYEQGRRKPSGPASTLLRVIEAEPEAVIRALQPRKEVRG
jgi:putative transcriptional regulator